MSRPHLAFNDLLHDVHRYIENVTFDDLDVELKSVWG
jgi:hypothetical protein